jgi:hypothetical protein
VRAALAEHNRRHVAEAVRVGRPAPAPLTRNDDHTVLRHIAPLAHLYRLAVEQAPDAPPARILATIADAYPAFADECAGRSRLTPTGGHAGGSRC